MQVHYHQHYGLFICHFEPSNMILFGYYTDNIAFFINVNKYFCKIPRNYESYAIFTVTAFKGTDVIHSGETAQMKTLWDLQ